MLPFFRSKKQNTTQDDVFLALDIGTEFIKAAIFSVDFSDLTITVRGYSKVRQHSSAMQGAMIVNLEQVISACDRAIGEALHHADRVANKGRGQDEEPVSTPIPTRTIMGIAGELVQGITIMADYTREDPDSKIDEEEMNEVIAHVKEQAFADAVEDIAEDIGVPVAALQELNSKINATYIDGVKVDNPLGFTGTEVTYRVFSTFAPSLHVNSLKEIAASLGLEVLSIEVQPYVISRAIKGSRSKDFSAVIIDVGGGTTDVAVVDQGGIIGTKMFAFGGRVFSRRIQKDLDLELHEAEQMKIDYSDGKLPKEQELRVRDALKKDITIWAEGIELSLEELDDLERYPTQFYLCGGGSALPEIREVLMEHPWLQVLPFRKYPKTSMLFPGQLEDIIDATDSIIDPADVTPLALARMILELV
ncbi:MAG: Cell division protein FtsA [candidate division WS6 bacterium OLB20]|uniref:Cell division protein FtsA n=1 Tax=candidate division WS6 bacterium OLB20 TaxID=1617426 RepID=A0A136LYS4_9BACT|nr:MAG: Cell division protein FtsA [candidate division WS6 bacterium OLB20]